MKTLIVSILVMMSTLSPELSWAQIFIDGDQYTTQFVDRVCRGSYSVVAELYAEASLEAIKAEGDLLTLNTNGIRALWERKGLSGKTDILLKSEMLAPALDKCYGSSHSKKAIFIASVYFINYLALGTSVAAWWTVGYLLKQGLGLVPIIEHLLKLGYLSQPIATQLTRLALGAISFSTIILAANQVKATIQNELGAAQQALQDQKKSFFEDLKYLEQMDADEKSVGLSSRRKNSRIKKCNYLIEISRNIIDNPAADLRTRRSFQAYRHELEIKRDLYEKSK